MKYKKGSVLLVKSDGTMKYYYISCLKYNVRDARKKSYFKYIEL